MATYYAASLAQADVQAAVDLCTPSVGDVVIMPAGEATWSSRTSDGPGSYYGITAFSIELRGAGSGLTIIHDQAQATQQSGLIAIYNDTILRGFTVIQDDTLYSASVVGGATSQNFRLTDVTVENIHRWGFHFAGNSSGPIAVGLIDHCTLVATDNDPAPSYQLIRVRGCDQNFPPSENSDPTSYKFSPGLGGADAVFIEDCHFSQTLDGDAAIETYLGAKVVVRYCTFRNFYVGVHGNDSGIRSGHTIEVYENTMVFDQDTYNGYLYLRGGGALVWNNTGSATGVNPDFNFAIALQSYRSRGDGSDPEFPYNMGQLDGSNPNDGNTPAANGSGTHTGGNGAASLTDSTKSALWTTNEMLGPWVGGTGFLQAYYVWNRTTGAGGRVTANTSTNVTVTLSGGTRQTWNTGDEYVITNGYPGLDQPGRVGPTVFNGVYSEQTLEPVRSWGNVFTYSGSPHAGAFAAYVDYMGPEYTALYQPDSGVMLVENRDFYNENLAFDGTTGNGVGLLADRPATCTTGVGYWATDERKLYVATATNTWGLHYEPYVYPHPNNTPTAILNVTTLTVGTVNIG